MSVAAPMTTCSWAPRDSSLGLPVLEPGTYRAEFLDLADESGTWRFRVGEFVINVLPGTAPGDLKRAGGTEMSGV